MSKVQVGETLAARLFAAEAAVDAAIVATAGLAAQLPIARTEAMLSAVTGQRAFDGAAGAVSSLVQARAQLVQTHKTLAALARSLKLDHLAVGPIDKPEDDPPIGDARPRVEFVHEAC